MIGGGDGTLKAAAENLEGAFGILPMGTMNLLAVDLGIPCDIKEAVQAYVGKPYKIIEIDTAYVNGEAFYCSAAIGLIPRSAVYREKHRHDPIFLLIPQLGLSILDHMDVQKYGQNFTVKMDMARKHKRLHTSNLIITNNEYEYVNGGQPIHFKRHSLQNNKLGIYTTRPRTLWDKLRVLAHFKFGDWTKDPAIKSWICEKLRVNCNEQKLTISLDGENIEVETPLEFHIDPQSRPLLVPGLDEQEEAA